MAGRIFVNYRRDDARDMAARIRDRLAATFGDANIFMDVDNLFAGQRFDLELDRALAKTRVFLAVIGPRWEEIFKQRLARGERDYVREEIAGALRRGLIVIPVLIERTPMPRAEDLPDDIRALVLHHKHAVTHEQFGRDIAGLVHAIRRGRWWTGAAALRWGIPIFAASLVLAGALTYIAIDRKEPPGGTSTTGSESGIQLGGGNHQSSAQPKKLPAAGHKTKGAEGGAPNGATSPEGTQTPLPGLTREALATPSKEPSPVAPPIVAPAGFYSIRLSITDRMIESLLRTESGVLPGKVRLLARGDDATSPTHNLRVAGTTQENARGEKDECPFGYKFVWTLEFELMPLAVSAPSRSSKVTGAECYGTKQIPELSRDALKRAVLKMIQELREWTSK
jgi:hypothetical protein